MTEEKTTPEEVAEPSEEEVEEERREIITPHPDVAHHPVDINAVNLNTLQNQAYYAYLQSLGQASANVSHASSPHAVQGGDELLVTLTLASPVVTGEPPYIVSVVYKAVQGGIPQTPGIFLYKQTTVAKFIPGLPNNGNLVQSFPLQTIRFDAQTKLGGPADITIEAHYQGQNVTKPGTGKFTIHAGV